MKYPILIFAFIVTMFGQVSAPTWTNYSPGSGPPAFAGWNSLAYDTIAMQVLVYSLNTTAQSTIYSTDFVFASLNSTKPAWTLQPGATHYTSDGTACAATNNVNQPKPRHPYPGFPIMDDYRQIGVLLGGSCAGGVQDMVYFVRHTNVSNNNGTFTVISPGGGTYPNTIQYGAGVYDPDDDIYYVFGYNGGAGQSLWIYCPTIPIGGGTATGTRTIKQTAYGTGAGKCSAVDTWLNITPGTVPPNSGELGASTLQNPSMVYDPFIHKVLLYGGTDANSTFYSNQIWSLTPSTTTFTELCGAGCTKPPAAVNGGNAVVGGILPIAMDTNRGYAWIHVPLCASGCPMDVRYSPSTDRWTRYTSNGGESDLDTVLGYDPINDRLMTYGLATPATTLADVWASAPIGGRTFLSGSGVPGSGTGNDGDLYHRTDTNAIYGPKVDGAWSSTYSYVTGVGCTTAYHIDKDCDGYGVYPTNLTADPNPLFNVDADDNDATVNTPASVITKWSTVSAFLTHLGYPTGAIVYIDPSLGSDGTGTGAVGNPYKSWDPVITSLSYSGSGSGATTLLYRAGYTSFSLGANSHTPFASSPASPIVVMPYPGERVVTYGINLDSQSYGKAANIIYDGWTLKCGNTGLGNGFDANHIDGVTLKNSEISGCGHGWQVGSGGQSLVIDNNIFHDISSHAVYPTSAGLYSSTQFNCPAWTWDITGGNFPSGFNPFKPLTVTNNLIYNAGTGGLEAVHLNAMICGGVVSGNLLHNIGGTGLGLQTSVQGTSGAPFLVQNNTIFANQSAAITLSIYGCDNNGAVVSAGQTDCTSGGFTVGGGPYYPNDFQYVSIVNNTLWTGQYATQGGGNCSPTDPSYLYGQCTIPSYGIQENDYEVPFNGTLGGIPDNHFLKNITIQNNLILTYNDCGGGKNQLEFLTKSYPDTNNIKNNLFYNLVAGNSQCNVMFIGATAQSGFPGTYTFTTFGSYNTGNNSNNLFSNPLFADAALGYYATPNLFNFHLTGSSPAIGAGLTSGAPSVDAAGLTRHNPPSIGAYEFSAAATTGGTSWGGKISVGGPIAGQ